MMIDGTVRHRTVDEPAAPLHGGRSAAEDTSRGESLPSRRSEDWDGAQAWIGFNWLGGRPMPLLMTFLSTLIGALLHSHLGI
jgi:hypothetical protein